MKPSTKILYHPGGDMGESSPRRGQQCGPTSAQRILGLFPGVNTSEKDGFRVIGLGFRALEV